MAKLIHILAASVGSGLVLGASIRLGEAIGASSRKRDRREPREDEIASRLNSLEQRLRPNSTSSPQTSSPQTPSGQAPEWQSVLASVTARMDRQQAEVQALRQQLSITHQPQETIMNPASELRREISSEMNRELDRRLASLEEKFQLSMESTNLETVDAMVASIERRLAPRIDRLESEISDQSAAVAALRDCSLQSERSIQRLLTVMEKTLNPRSRAGDPEPGQLSVVSR